MGDTFHSIFHHNEFDRLLVLHSHRVDTIDTSQQTVIVTCDMGKISFLDALEGVKITVSQSFDDEFLVLGEEEKAAALALRFTSLEHHTSVGFWVERFSQDFVIVTISLTKEGKYIGRVFCNLNVLIDDKPLFRLKLGFFSVLF